MMFSQNETPGWFDSFVPKNVGIAEIIQLKFSVTVN